MASVTWVALLLASVLVAVQGCSLQYRCGTSIVNYKVKCGMFGWSRCSRRRTEAKMCTKPCPVDARMSAWSSYRPSGSCSKSCGTGSIKYIRHRTCTPARYGGKACAVTTESRTSACNTRGCPVDAKMSAWSTWLPASSCSRSCGLGKQKFKRYRKCTPARYGGKGCAETISYKTSTCITRNCPVDARMSAWSAWTTYTSCTKSCGTGSQKSRHTRTCTPPRYGGKSCSSTTEYRTDKCNTQQCPIHGEWSEWEDWQPVDNCPVLCGGAQSKMTRSRKCDLPVPQFGGNDCKGDSSQYQDPGPCNTQACGELCPEGERKFHAHSTDTHMFYKCDSSRVARLVTCPDLATWSTESERCVPISCDISGGLLHSHPNSCNKFIFCLMGKRAMERNCPQGEAWDDSNKRCATPFGGECFV